MTTTTEHTENTANLQHLSRKQIEIEHELIFLHTGRCFNGFLFSMITDSASEVSLFVLHLSSPLCCVSTSRGIQVVAKTDACKERITNIDTNILCLHESRHETHTGRRLAWLVHPQPHISDLSLSWLLHSFNTENCM